MWKLKVVKSSSGLRKAKQYKDWNLYDQSRENSRFYQLYHHMDTQAEQSEFITIELWIEGACRGVAHFQAYDDRYFKAVGHRKVWMMGRLGVYVDPLLRGQGFAGKLLCRLESEIHKKAALKPQYIPLVCARMGANPLCARLFSHLHVTDSLDDPRQWRKKVNHDLKKQQIAAREWRAAMKQPLDIFRPFMGGQLASGRMGIADMR